MSEVTYKLDELARAAGTSARTVRYYVQRGLLQAPAFRGKDTAYSREHLIRLRAIRRLQDAFFPLDAIAIELERASPSDLEEIADGKKLPAQTPTLQIMPAPKPVQLSEAAVARVFQRFVIAPGLELSLADDAPLEARELAQKILQDSRTKEEKEKSS